MTEETVEEAIFPAHDDRGRNETTIVVNGRPKTVRGNQISYEAVVKLAYDDPPSGPSILITVTYRNGLPPRPEGTLLPGQTVRIQDRMIFNVVITDKS